KRFRKISIQALTSPFLQTKTECLNRLENALKLAHANLKLPQFGAFVSKKSSSGRIRGIKKGR
ncbi:hypothetical protein OPAG_09356, partial [Rhodococcus opacus PD630]